MSGAKGRKECQAQGFKYRYIVIASVERSWLVSRGWRVSRASTLGRIIVLIVMYSSLVWNVVSPRAIWSV